MKRRGFLKLMGAAPIAAPVMAKEAAANMVAELPITGAKIGASLSPSQPGGPPPSNIGWAVKDLRRLFTMSAQELARRKQLTSVHTLDADLASLRSIALWKRVQMQRDRNFERDIANEKSWLQHIIDRGDE
jgi:hypothetical protein